MPYRLVFVLPLLLTAFASAREHTRNWIEVRSSHFTIVTNSSEKAGRRIAIQFERMRAIFQEAYPQLEGGAGLPVVVLAIKDKDQFRALEPRAYVAKNALPLHGLFVGGSDKNYILMRLDSEAGNPYPVVYHEYTHLFLREADEWMPLWLNEGLAEFYENAEIYEQDVLLGEPSQKHLMLLRQENLLPLPTLFTVDEKSPYYLDEKKGGVFYAECWALTHYLTLKDYADKTSKVFQYISLVNEKVDPVTAANRVFGDLRKLQRSLEIYIEQKSFDHFETRISHTVDVSGLQVKSMTAAQAEGVKADYLAASGRLEEAKALLAAAGQEAQSAAESTTVAGAQGTPAEKKVPSEVDEEIACPLAQVLQGASQRATEMVENLQRFTATEKIEHTEFKKSGKPRQSVDQLFSYLAEIEQAPSGSFWVEEYRTAKTEGDRPPLSDTGTAAFALIFHPLKIGNFEFHCDGQTYLHGISAWQLRFEESADPSKSFHQMRIQGSVYQLRFKGRAWIAAKDFQIVRLETDLMMPIPEIRLQQEHLDISYAPVEFDKSKFRVWLPEKAALRINYRGRSYERVHRFSHFQLFLVVTEETVKAPSPGPGG